MAAALIRDRVFPGGVERLCACGASALGRAPGFEIGLPFEARGAEETGLCCWGRERAPAALGFEPGIFSASFSGCISMGCVAACVCGAFGSGAGFASAGETCRPSDGAIF